MNKEYFVRNLAMDDQSYQLNDNCVIYMWDVLVISPSVLQIFRAARPSLQNLACRHAPGNLERGFVYPVLCRNRWAGDGLIVISDGLIRCLNIHNSVPKAVSPPSALLSVLHEFQRSLRMHPLPRFQVYMACDKESGPGSECLTSWQE